MSTFPAAPSASSMPKSYAPAPLDVGFLLGLAIGDQQRAREGFELVRAEALSARREERMSEPRRIGWEASEQGIATAIALLTASPELREGAEPRWEAIKGMGGFGRSEETWLHAICHLGREWALPWAWEMMAPSARAQRNRDGLSPLDIACSAGDVACAQALLALGAPHDEANPVDGARALYWAAQAPSLPCVELLLKAGADPNAIWRIRPTDIGGRESISPLEAAVSEGEGARECVEALLRAGARLQVAPGEAPRRSALHHAVGRGHAKIALLLLEAGADPEARDAHGNRPGEFDSGYEMAPRERLLAQTRPAVELLAAWRERVALSQSAPVRAGSGLGPAAPRL